MLTQIEIARLSDEFETQPPQEILRWAIGQFWPQIAMSCSFQTQSMPLLHMATQIRHDLLIFFLDTGYHFWDTLIFREQVASHWKLNVLDLYRDKRWDAFAHQHSRNLPLEDPDLCCYLNKVQPMQKALGDLQAWISGIRRDQTTTRAHARILELEPDGLLKVNPLLTWTRRDVEAYIREHALPVHPLLAKGYRSIGCAPCTVAIGTDQDERAGRWAGRGKTECGLHTRMFEQKDFNGFTDSIHLDGSEQEE
ncbi:MAG: phosphoadenylyl-sulfate reductase [Anaerolineales bacterium]